uniref:hypothetical protein n=1 Tax=Peribacillus tepidiphilus TaxID=2652445 RepID=UPI0035B518E4
MKQTKEAVPPHLLEEAFLLRREVPGRSVSQIIQILEWEGKAQPGHLKRSTLQEKLAERLQFPPNANVYQHWHSCPQVSETLPQ